MARAIAIGTAIGAAVAACFTTPTRPPGDGLRDDAGNLLIDASEVDDADPDSTFISPDAPDGTCGLEEFDGSGSGSCGTTGWGTVSSSGSGYASLSSGELTLGLFSGSNASYVQCASPIGNVQRVTVDVSSVAATMTGGETTFVGLATTDNLMRWGLHFTYDSQSTSAGYVVQCPSGGTSATPTEWDSTLMRYVQVEKWMTGSVRISAGSNNSQFQQLHVCSNGTAVHQGSTVVQLRLNKPASATSPQPARFRRLEICR